MARSRSIPVRQTVSMRAAWMGGAAMAAALFFVVRTLDFAERERPAGRLAAAGAPARAVEPAPPAPAPSRRPPAPQEAEARGSDRAPGPEPAMHPPGEGTGHEHLRGLDPLDALTLLDGMEDADTAFLFEAYSFVLEPGLAARGDWPAIRMLLETTPRADVRRLLIAAFSDIRARHDPEETAAWIASLPSDPERTRILGDVVSTWAAREPEKAAAFAGALPPGEARRVALKNIVWQWRTRDSASAGEWLIRSELHADFDAAAAALAP